MRQYGRGYNSLENKKKRSDAARKAANCRWAAEFADREPRKPRPDKYFTISVKNDITGKTTVVEFKPGTRKNNFRIEIDGKYWKTCGVVGAEGLIFRSLAKASRTVSRTRL